LISSLNRKIKMIWDFKGNDAKEMAKHHEVNLLEFAHKKELSLKTTSGRNSIKKPPKRFLKCKSISRILSPDSYRDSIIYLGMKLPSPSNNLPSEIGRETLLPV